MPWGDPLHMVTRAVLRVSGVLFRDMLTELAIWLKPWLVFVQRHAAHFTVQFEGPAAGLIRVMWSRGQMEGFRSLLYAHTARLRPRTVD